MTLFLLFPAFGQEFEVAESNLGNAFGVVKVDTAPLGCGEVFAGDRVGNKRAALAVEGQIRCLEAVNDNSQTIVALNVVAAGAGIRVLPGGGGMVAPGGASGEAYLRKGDMVVALGDATAPIHAASVNGWGYQAVQPGLPGQPISPLSWGLDGASWYMRQQGPPVVHRTIVEPTTTAKPSDKEGKADAKAETPGERERRAVEAATR